MEPLAYAPFTDGTFRPVFEEPDGRQYVIGDDGGRVYGVWLKPTDDPAPLIVPAAES